MIEAIQLLELRLQTLKILASISNNPDAVADALWQFYNEIKAIDPLSDSSPREIAFRDNGK